MVTFSLLYSLFIISLDTKSIVAMILLYYMLPDTRAKLDHNKIVIFIPVSEVGMGSG